MMFVALVASATAAALAPGPAVPAYSSTFVVHTVEVDDTLGVNSIYQTIAIDLGMRRSHMTADGVLNGAAGHLEQVRRCDFHPEGYALDIHGAPFSAPSTWDCTNSSVNPAPADCQFSNFWELPANISYVGPAKINETACDKWEYWDNHERYNFWGTAQAPLRIGKVYTSVKGYSLWHIDFTGFAAYSDRDGGVPMPYFDLPTGTKCPPATPPSVPASDASFAPAVRPTYLHAAAKATKGQHFGNNQLQQQEERLPAARMVSAVDACYTGVNVTFNNSVYQTKYVVTVEAPSGSAAVTAPMTKVSAVVVGALHNGSVFWNSTNPPVAPDGEFTYTFDARPRQLIVGFDVGSYGMQVGETRVLCIPPGEGYGNKDRKDGNGKVIIPAGSTLLFTLTCGKIVPPSQMMPTI